MKQDATAIVLTKRQKSIVECLLSKDGYVPTSEIASLLNVSAKTIYRELDFLKNNENKTGIYFDSKIGNGVKITNPEVANNLIKNFSTSSQKRYVEVMNYLLRESPNDITLDSLSNKFYVSKTSIKNDIEIIEKELQDYSLKIKTGKKGIRIEGDEFNIRRALANSLISYEGFDNSYSRMNTRLEKSTRQALCDKFSNELVDYIEYVVRSAEEDLGYEIVDPYYINIVTHLLIMIIRVMQGRLVGEREITLSSINVHKMKVAIDMSKKIEDRYRIKILDNDVRYMYEHLDSIGYTEEIIDKTQSNPISIDEDIKKFSTELLVLMEETLHHSLRNDEAIIRYILRHIHSMIMRLKYRIDIKCSLMNEIKGKYSELFDLTKRNVSKLLHEYYPQYSITDDEVAYLTIYFQSLLENRVKDDLRVIVVCSSSVGTSHMLMLQIKNRFPNWTIVDQLPASKLETMIGEYEDIDLILSTVRIKEYSLSIPIAFVSVMFTDNDVITVKQVLEEIKK